MKAHVKMGPDYPFSDQDRAGYERISKNREWQETYVATVNLGRADHRRGRPLTANPFRRNLLATAPHVTGAVNEEFRHHAWIAGWMQDHVEAAPAGPGASDSLRTRLARTVMRVHDRETESDIDFLQTSSELHGLGVWQRALATADALLLDNVVGEADVATLADRIEEAAVGAAKLGISKVLVGYGAENPAGLYAAKFIGKEVRARLGFSPAKQEEDRHESS